MNLSFPIVGTRFRLDLLALEHDEAGQQLATIRLEVLDDLKEQQIYFLPARHQNERGAEYLARMAVRIAAMDAERIRYVMPHDLWPSWAILDTPLSLDNVMRALDDPRSLRMLEQDHDVLSIDPDRVEPPTLANPELEARILAGDDAYAVYGDWLAERGDPRGELIAAQLAGHREEEQRLLEEHAFAWLRGLAWPRPGEMTVTWKNGFIEAVRFGQEQVDDNSSETGFEHELRELARLPNIAFLRRLELFRKAYWDNGVFAVLGEVELPIEELAIAQDWHVAELDTAYCGLTKLRTLKIEAHQIDLGELYLPRLRSLELITRSLTNKNLEAITPERLPQLESLTLWLGTPGVDDCDVDSVAIAALLARTFPHLRMLGLCDREIAEVLPLVVASPLLPQLRRLDLVGIEVRPDDVEVIREHAATLVHLEALHLGSHGVGSPLVDLARLGLPIVHDDRFIPVYE